MPLEVESDAREWATVGRSTAQTLPEFAIPQNSSSALSPTKLSPRFNMPPQEFWPECITLIIEP